MDQPETSERFADGFVRIDNPNAIINSLICQVCADLIVIEDMVQLSCGHELCRDCLKEHVNTQANISLFSYIRCHSCDEMLDLMLVESILQENNATNFKKYQIQYIVRALFSGHTDDEIAWCPDPKCGLPSWREETNCRNASCPYCLQRFCASCGTTTEGTYLHMCGLKSNLGSERTTVCQKCKAVIQKDGGCDHINCRICGNEICWVCGCVTYNRLRDPPVSFNCACGKPAQFCAKMLAFPFRVCNFFGRPIAKFSENFSQFPRIQLTYDVISRIAFFGTALPSMAITFPAWGFLFSTIIFVINPVLAIQGKPVMKVGDFKNYIGD